MLHKFYTPGLVNINSKGFNRVREFYSPRYDKAESVSQLPDLRSTIYRNPYLKTGGNGKTSFNFFNADRPGIYKIIVEAINADGSIGRSVFKYNVD